MLIKNIDFLTIITPELHNSMNFSEGVALISSTTFSTFLLFKISSNFFTCFTFESFFLKFFQFFELFLFE